MSAADLLIWLALVLCLILSFLFSGMEAGVFALSRMRIRRLMRSGRSSARLLHGFLENPEEFLWTIVVGNTVVNFMLLGWTVSSLHSLLGSRRVLFVLVFALIVFLFYALFDLLPKTVFRAYPNRLCMFFAKPFKFAYLAFRPAVLLVEQSSVFLLHWTGGKTFTGRLFGNREEFRQMMQESAQAFTSEERMMINRVLDLQTLTVQQVATPLSEATTVSSQTPTHETLALARERGLTRLPVWEMRDGHRRIVGLVALRVLLYQADLDPDKPVGDYVRPALYVEEDLRLEAALHRMQRAGQRLAVVLARDGKETGLVGLEDILKAIFGDVKL
jgi:magnesium and cobalt exporter, CNNM family